FFCQAEDGIRDRNVTGVQTCALPICHLSSWESDGICACVNELSKSGGGQGPPKVKVIVGDSWTVCWPGPRHTGSCACPSSTHARDRKSVVRGRRGALRGHE